MGMTLQALTITFYHFMCFRTADTVQYQITNALIPQAHIYGSHVVRVYIPIKRVR